MTDTTPPSTESSCFENTKKILWKNPKQDIGYQDYVAEDNGAIVMCAGGYCVGKTVKDWVELAWPKSERGLQAYRQQSAPDEGEMEKLWEKTLNRASKDFNGPMFTLTKAELFSFRWEIESLQSRLKQVEAERDSYMEDAERMYDGILQIEDYTKSDGGEAHTIAEQLLRSLSNHYPPNI